MQIRIFCILGIVGSSSLLACGGDSNVGDAGNDATTDSPSGNDAAPDSSASDAAGDAGSEAAPPGDAGDGGPVVTLGCANPSECDGGAFCCGTVDLNGGTPPNCNVASITTACAAQCNTSLQFSCTVTETVRLCGQPSDCTENQYSKCCTFQTGNQQTTFCASQQIANAAGATCM